MLSIVFSVKNKNKNVFLSLTFWCFKDGSYVNLNFFIYFKRKKEWMKGRRKGGKGGGREERFIDIKYESK